MLSTLLFMVHYALGNVVVRYCAEVYIHQEAIMHHRYPFTLFSLHSVYIFIAHPQHLYLTTCAIATTCSTPPLIGAAASQHRNPPCLIYAAKIRPHHAPPPISPYLPDKATPLYVICMVYHSN